MINLDEILQVPAAGALAIGPADLSYSMGLLLVGHSSVQEAFNTIITKANVVHILAHLRSDTRPITRRR